MRLSALALSVLSLLPLTTTSFDALAVDQEKILNAKKAVVMVRGYNSKGGLSYGSGVVIAENKIISNCHIFRDTLKPWVARGEDTYNIVSVKADAKHDLCLLTAENLPIPPIALAKDGNIQRGEEVISIGHSNAAPAPLTSVGVIKSIYDYDGGNIIRSTAQFRMGASGSGLFNLNGELIGINTFKTPGKNAYFYSLPAKWIATVEQDALKTSFPVNGQAFWEAEDKQKPYFMQVALPEIDEDWQKLSNVSDLWTKKEPHNVEAWYELGLAHDHLNQLDKAQEAYATAVALDETHIDALFRLGIIAHNKGDKVGVHDINEKIAKIDKGLAQQYGKMLGCNAEC